MKQALIIIVCVLAFCVSGPGQAASSADTILVNGRPPLTQKMVDDLIDLFEFGLQGKFSEAERNLFTQHRIAEWKSGDEEKKADVVSLLETRAQLLVINENDLREAQAEFQHGLLEIFRAQPEDETSRLLLGVYQRARAAETSKTGVVAGTTSRDLLGTWQTGSVSSIGFVNPATGVMTSGGGTQVMYTFHAGGRYEYAALTQQTMYNCTTKLYTYKTGTVEIRGGTLTFVPKSGSFTSEDNCNSRFNYKKPASLDRETYTWSIERDEYGIKLCLRNEGTNGCAYKR